MGFFADQVLQVYVWFERLLCLYRLYETGLKVIVKIQLFFANFWFCDGLFKTFSMIFSGSISIIKLYIVKIVGGALYSFFFLYIILLIKCYTIRKRLRNYVGLLFRWCHCFHIFLHFCFCFSSARKGTIFDKIPYMIPLQTSSVDSPLAASSIVTVLVWL